MSGQQTNSDLVEITKGNGEFKKNYGVCMVIGFLPAEFAKHLKETVPEESYETTAQWIVALKSTWCSAADGA